MIDLSDGLSTDLSHICEESQVGAQLDADFVPRARIDKSQKLVDLRFALHGGDDYELLFTARPGKKIPARIAGVAVTKIGRITRDRGMTLLESGRASRLNPQGWEHFRG